MAGLALAKTQPSIGRGSTLHTFLALAFLIIIWIGAAANISQINFNHPLVYTILFGSALIVLPNFLRQQPYELAFATAYLVCATAFLLDFACLNFLRLNLSASFVLSEVRGFAIPYNRGPYFSPSGPLEEPGDLAFFLCAMFPFVAAIALRRHGAFGLLAAVAIHVLALIGAFSSASLVMWPLSLTIAGLTYILLNPRQATALLALLRRPLYLRRAVLTVLLLFGAMSWGATIVISSPSAQNMFAATAAKAQFSAASGSAVARQNDFILAKSTFAESPVFGKGVGYFSSTHGFVPQNFYLLILAETGIAGATLLFGLIAAALWAVRSNFSLYWSLIYSCLHLFVISDVWQFAFLYVLAASSGFSSSPPPNFRLRRDFIRSMYARSAAAQDKS